MIDVNVPFKVTIINDLTHACGWVRFTMPTGHYQGGEFTVTANFTDETDYPGENFVRGKAVDEFGWEHTGLVLSVAQARKVEFTHAHPPVVTLEPFRVGIKFDNLNRLRLTVPDDVAVRLRTWADSVWTEHGWNSGSTAPAAPGTWEHQALAYLHSLQCRLGERPIIEGESYSQGNNAPLVSVHGVAELRPTGGFHFTG